VKVLFKQHYFGRLLFVIEIKDEIVMVYKSSGLSGTGHGGQILPFIYINAPSSRQSLRDQPGYIYKEMWYDNKFRHHDKNIDWYNNLEENMKYISNFLEAFGYDMYLEEEDCHSDSLMDIYKFMDEVNTDLHYICDGRNFYDLKNLIKERK